jgi:hypothetical protein
VQLDPGDLGLVDAAAEAAVEVPRHDRRTVPGGEDQAGIDPGISRSLPVGVLLFLAELERSDTQVRERQRCLGCFGLGPVADELAVGPLDLLFDVELSAVKVYQFPGEPQQLTSAQTEDQDQDVSAVQHIVVAAGGLKAARPGRSRRRTRRARLRSRWRSRYGGANAGRLARKAKRHRAAFDVQ